MAQTTSTGYSYPSPQVFIAVRKNRVKMYGDATYLPNGTEFQLEFNNNTAFTQKAEIFINGKLQSHALVLRPGEHYYLDRFMDKDRKLKFDTYEVDDNQEVKKIIENNGLIEIKFYKEYIAPVITWYNTTTTTWPQYYYTTSYEASSNMNAFDDGHSYKSSTNKTMRKTSLSSTNNQVYCSSVGSTMSSAKIETGRVAQGDKSNQQFVEVNQTFEYFPNTTIKYRILPISQKPAEVYVTTTTQVRTQDIRNYCPNCGRRIKRGWVHCAGCGEKI